MAFIAQAQAPMSSLSLIVLSVGVLLYFLPTIVAAMRRLRNLAPIVVVNVLLGWSVIGWIIAMVWAVSTQVVGTPPIASTPRTRTPATKRCTRCGEYSLSTARVCAFCEESFTANA
jgi:hypothetical protein